MQTSKENLLSKLFIKQKVVKTNQMVSTGNRAALTLSRSSTGSSKIFKNK